MKKLEVTMLISIVIAALGIIAFWVFGINNQTVLAAYSITIAGICGYVFLGCLWIHHKRQRWMA